MDLKQMFLAQLEREAVATRRTLERVPEGRNDWKPHERSMTLGYLSGLVASMPGWAEFMIERDELDLSHPSAEPFKTKVLENRIELLKTLDDGLIKSRKALERTTAERLERPWRFVMGGRILFRRTAIRGLERIAFLPHGTPPRTTHSVSPSERGHRTRDLRSVR